MNKNYVILGGSVTVALVAGGVGGYLFGKTKLEEYYADLAAGEIQAAKEYYKTLYKKEGFETPEAAVEKLIPKAAVAALKTYQGNQVVPEKGGEIQYQKAELRTDVGSLAIEETVELSVFKEVTAEHSRVDIEMEIRNRTEEAPYIISKEEYFEDAANHSQVTLTYYEGDGVLADERDEAIPDIDHTVGDNNIVRFGHRSEDPNVLYIRNHVLGTDFEICLDKGKYSELVAGFVGTD